MDALFNFGTADYFVYLNDCEIKLLALGKKISGKLTRTRNDTREELIIILDSAPEGVIRRYKKFLRKNTVFFLEHQCVTTVRDDTCHRFIYMREDICTLDQKVGSEFPDGYAENRYDSHLGSKIFLHSNSK